MAKYDLTTIPPKRRGYFSYLSGHYGSPISMSYAYENGVPSQEAINQTVLNFLTGFKTKEEVSNNLYNNIKPRNYGTPMESFWRIVNAANNKTHEGWDDYRDDIWATYLGIPENQRHYRNNNNLPKVIPSKYKPTKGTNNNNTNYYTLSNIRKNLNDIAEYGSQKLNYGQNEVSHHLGEFFGDHTIGKGRDKNGTYISYYDLWNLDPFQNGNTDNFIGKPVEFYDRVYLDDYYGIPRDPKSTYIPEVVISPYLDENGNFDYNKMWRAQRAKKKSKK